MDCNNNNPITPYYSMANFVTNPNCVCNKNTIYLPPDSNVNNDIELIAGVDIAIDDLSTVDGQKFRINYNPYESLIVTSTLIVRIAGTAISLPITKGRTVDGIQLNWTYNKQPITSQTFTLDGTDESLAVGIRESIKSGLDITSNEVVTITGDDGESRPGSIHLDSKTITFGNYQIYGNFTKMLGENVSTVNNMIANLADKVTITKTTRQNSVYATGGSNRYFLIIYPKAWGEATFRKGLLDGGFIRLMNQAGTLVSSISEGNTEASIEWTNEFGYTEEIYIYQSMYDNIEDDIAPVQIL